MGKGLEKGKQDVDISKEVVAVFCDRRGREGRGKGLRKAAGQTGKRNSKKVYGGSTLGFSW